MDKDRIKGKVKEIEGRVQAAKGDLTNSNSDKVEGALKQIEGSAQNKIGKIKDAIRKESKK